MFGEEPPLFEDRSVQDWDRDWIEVPGGLKHYQPSLRYKVGLYRVRFAGRVVAIGVATERVGGLAKRLSDFFRPSASGRNHHVGQLINEHLDELVVEVLITGEGTTAQKVAQQLKAPMIHLHRAVWSLAGTMFPTGCWATSSSPGGAVAGERQDGGRAAGTGNQ